jgi:single-stranded-DNA-specific exonuclease
MSHPDVQMAKNQSRARQTISRFPTLISHYTRAMHRRWILPGDAHIASASRLAREHGLPPLVAGLLCTAGLSDRDPVEQFLHPRLRTLSDPNLLSGMPAAIARLDEALRERQRIVLYGDYDVDGVASLALLHRVLSAYGGCVECFLPMREGEGYGLSAAGLERCIEQHRPQLLVAVDCGTNSVAEIAALRSQSVDVIVLDHHEPDRAENGERSQLPACAALVNPKIDGGEFASLCSAGVVFKTAHALLKASPLPGFDLREVLDLVALATICDLVPLVGENRIFVRAGLLQMPRTRWPGLAALLRISNVSPPVRASDIGFRVGPRINAAGRIGTAREALQLLLTNDEAEATRIAASLDARNRERQAVERDVTVQIETWLEKNFDASRDAAIVAGARDWHQGVLGIVASRVMRRHHRPTLIVGFDETGQGKGSGRSIEGLSLVEALRRCEVHLGNYGGHEMAAGLNVREEDFDAFREAFATTARDMVTEDMLVPRLHLHAEIALTDFGDELLATQEMLEPFGNGNTQPLLFVRGLSPMGEPRVLKEKHLRLAFGGRPSVNAIFFNGAENPLPRPPWDVAFHLERNDYNGRVEPQMQIVAIRAAA